jgi:xylose isomerase
MDTCARALKAAAYLFEDEVLEQARKARYAGWEREGAQAMLLQPLEVIAQAVIDSNINPQPRSGRQERLENLWNHYI